MKYPTNIDILSSKPQLGWVVGKDWEIAAIPLTRILDEFSKRYQPIPHGVWWCGIL
jgi:hypothetical protein